MRQRKLTHVIVHHTRYRYIHMYLSIYIYIDKYNYTYIHTYTHIHTDLHTYIHTYIDIYMCMCICVHNSIKHAYSSVCVYIHIVSNACVMLVALNIMDERGWHLAGGRNDCHKCVSDTYNDTMFGTRDTATTVLNISQHY